jgi:hypothetical protein
MRAAQMWVRMSTAQKVASATALGLASTLVFCCGGLTALGAIIGSPPQKSQEPRPAATRFVATPAQIAPLPSESPSASPSALPTTPAPPSTTTQAPPPPPPPPAPTTTEAAPPPPPPPPPPDEVYYANCAEARAAGAAPLYAGEPGYRPALDRDHDGVACE